MKVKKEYRFIITRVIVALAVLMIDKIKRTSPDVGTFGAI